MRHVCAARQGRRPQTADSVLACRAAAQGAEVRLTTSMVCDAPWPCVMCSGAHSALAGSFRARNHR